ncbi:MAG: CinA family protein [Anaerolineaceae bacterium]|nr:CinA family protein [Anaerolineaceae bacterium]
MDDNLAINVGAALNQRGLKLITAESCTGGLIGDMLTDVPGSSEYFICGIVAYAYEAKMRLLGVPPGLLAQFGAVSRETVLEMARGARIALADEYPLDTLVSISVSGIAGPGGGMPEKPVGLVWIGMSTPDGDRAWRYVWDGNRRANKLYSAEQALRLLLDYLQNGLSEE